MGPARIWSLLKQTYREFDEDECGTRSAALAYYTVFALPPLLILLIRGVGMIWSPDEVQRTLEAQFALLMGRSGAEQVRQIIAQSNASARSGIAGVLVSLAGLILGATGFFLSLQDALNRAWEVKPDPAQGGIRGFIFKRILSLGMVLGLVLLLAVSLALSAALSALAGYVGGGLWPQLMEAVNFVVSFVVLTALFAAVFKVLPDAKIDWRDVWIGAVVTSLLFVVGKFVIGLYLGRLKPGDAFGAASALAVVLIWAYYASMILLFGAEFTQAWTKTREGGVEPEPGAVHVVEQEKVMRPGQPPRVE